MGALFLNQASIWRWDGDHAELLWIDAYNLSAGGEESDILYRNGELSILEKEIPTHIHLVQRLFRADNTAPAPHHA
jgi:hypothetical protein